MLSPHFETNYPSDLISLNNIHLNIVNSCGYCSSKKTWVTSGFSSPQMSCETYQILLEKGWRRCGTFYYKPDLTKCCCRPYSIRLEAQKYKFRGSHLQSLRKFGNFLKKQSDPPLINPDPPELDSEAKQLLFDLYDEIKLRFKINGKALELMKSEEKEKIRINAPNLKTKKFQKTSNLMWLIFIVNEPILRSENIDFKSFREILAIFIEEFMKQKNSNLLLQCHHSGYISIKLKEKQVKKINTQEFIQNILSDSTTGFEIKTVPAAYEEESYEIYRKYSQVIHNITESESSYRSFLCQQALNTTDFSGLDSDSSNDMKYGCFHMKYYYNKKLIAVGVIDILPKGLSSVYFFYDPDYKRNSLGVIGSLREIALVMNLSNILPKFQYYYMGYYIQNSKKMKYKGNFEPAELLCPKTMKWVPLNEKTRTLINQNKEDPGISEESPIEGKKNDELVKEYFLGKKKLFFLDDWIQLGELQSKYVNHFIDNMIGLGKAMGKDVMDRLEFTMI